MVRDQAAGLRELVRALPPLEGLEPYSIAIASGKGGVGKTTLAVNLALALGELGHGVLLWDADFSLANADLLLRLCPQRTVHDVLQGKASVEEVLLPVRERVWLLPGASGVGELARLDGHAFATLHAGLKGLGGRFSVVLVDVAAGVGPDVLASCLAAHHLLLITTSEPTALTDAYGLLKVLAQHRFSQRVSIVVNRVASPQEEEAGQRLGKAARRFLGLEVEVGAAVPESPWVSEAVRRQIPLLALAPSCPAARAIRLLAHQLARTFPSTERPRWRG